MTNRSLRRETEKRVPDGKGPAGHQGRNDNLAAAGFCPPIRQSNPRIYF